MIKRVGKFLVVFVSLLIVFILILILTSLIPSNWIKQNVKESSETLVNEGNRKIVFAVEKFQYEQFDNYSDALMINTAYSVDCKSPLYSALTAKKDYIPGVTKEIHEDKIGELSSSSKYEYHDEVSELKDTVNGEAPEAFEYAKYWHGYLVFLRPLLLIFNYWQIRVLLMVVLAILAIWLLYLVAQKIGKAVTAIIGLCLVEIEYFYLGLSLLNSTTMLIAMISGIVMLKKYEKIKDFSLFFFIVGIALGFFTLLDIPLITFGIPILLYFLLKNKSKEINIKETILEILKYGIFWVLGYSLIWISKWILTDLICGKNLLTTALGQVLYRSAGAESSGVFAICINILNVAVPLMINLILLEYLLIRYCHNITVSNFKKAIPFFIISCMPIVWYYLLSNHSSAHVFFTYRILFLSMACILIGIYITCGEPEENKKM